MLNTDICLFYMDNRIHANCMNEEHDGLLRNRFHCKQYEGLGTYINA